MNRTSSKQHLNQGSISAQQALTLNAGNDIQVESTTFNSNNSAQK
ncbi:hypothetical protein [Methylophilus sp. QUAN]|nr:hypothetical protein [Methylophilus sp. QUAN]